MVDCCAECPATEKGCLFVRRGARMTPAARIGAVRVPGPAQVEGMRGAVTDLVVNARRRSSPRSDGDVHLGRGDAFEHPLDPEPDLARGRKERQPGGTL